MGYFLAGAIAFGGTEALKRAAVGVLGPAAVVDHTFLVVLASGALAVSCCCLVTTPFEAARISLVGGREAGPSFGGGGGGGPASLPALVLAKAREPGVYAGLPALLVRDVPFHATKFAAFEAAAAALRASAWWPAEALPAAATTFAAGLAAGLVAAVVSQPADATFTRCQRATPAEGAAEGAAVVGLSPPAAFLELAREGGLLVGLSSRCVFGALLVALQFAAYDAAKAALGVGPEDLTLFLDALSGLQAPPGA